MQSTYQYNELPITDFEGLRIPPHSIDAESSLKRALLLDNEAMDQIADMLTKNDFYRHDHRLIYRHLAGLIAADKPADVLTVFEELRTKSKDQDFGGLANINQLAQYVPSPRPEAVDQGCSVKWSVRRNLN